MGSPSRSLPNAMRQVTSSPGRSVPIEVQQQVTSVCFTNPRLLSLGELKPQSMPVP